MLSRDQYDLQSQASQDWVREMGHRTTVPSLHWCWYEDTQIQLICKSRRCFYVSLLRVELWFGGSIRLFIKELAFEIAVPDKKLVLVRSRRKSWRMSAFHSITCPTQPTVTFVVTRTKCLHSTIDLSSVAKKLQSMACEHTKCSNTSPEGRTEVAGSTKVEIPDP